MVGEECVCPVRTSHLDWCGLAGIVKAIVETFPKNCALMFPPSLVPAATPSFTSTFKPASSNEDDDDDTLGSGRDFRRFDTSTPTPVDGGRGSTSAFGGAPSFSSSSLPYGSAFIMASDNIEACSGAPPIFKAEQGDHNRGNANDELDLGVEANDDGDGNKGMEGEAVAGPRVDPNEVEMLKKIIKQYLLASSHLLLPSLAASGARPISTVVLPLQNRSQGISGSQLRKGAYRPNYAGVSAGKWG